MELSDWARKMGISYYRGQAVSTTKEITRSLLFSLEFANSGKKSSLQRLWNACKEVMQHLIDVGIAHNRIPDYQKVKTCPVGSFLSARYKGCASQQAKAILKSYSKLKKKHKNEAGREIFSSLRRNPETQEWIEYPIKNYEYAKEYFENWKLRPFVEILQKDGKR